MPSFRKQFIAANGLQIGENLIVANVDSGHIGIGTSVPNYTLDVVGGIGATDAYFSGIATAIEKLDVGLGGTALTVSATGSSPAVGIGTTNPQYLLDVRSSIGTGVTTLNVEGDAKISGDVTAGNLILDSGSFGSTLYVTGIATFDNSVTINDDLYVSGISTFDDSSYFNGTVSVSGASTFTSSVDIQSNLSATSLSISNGSFVAGVGTTAAVVNGNLNVFDGRVVVGFAVTDPENQNFVTISSGLGTDENKVAIGSVFKAYYDGVTGVVTAGRATLDNLVVNDTGSFDQITGNYISLNQISYSKSGTLSGQFTDTITGINTDNIEVGYRISGPKLQQSTTVSEVGVSSLRVSPPSSNDYLTSSKEGRFLGTNSTTIVSLGSTTNIGVGYSVFGNSIVSGTTIASIVGPSTITISIAATNTVGQVSVSNIAVGPSTTVISGISTTGLAIGQFVEGDLVQSGTTIIGIGTTSVTINFATQNGISTTINTFTFYKTESFSFSSPTPITNGTFRIAPSNSGLGNIPSISGIDFDYETGIVTSISGDSANFIQANFTGIVTTNELDSDNGSITSFRSTFFDSTNLNVTGVSTFNNANVTGIITFANFDAVSGIISNLTSDYITSANYIGTDLIISGVGTIGDLFANVLGLSTVNTVEANISGIVSATNAIFSGITTAETFVSASSSISSISGQSLVYDSATVDTLKLAGVNTANSLPFEIEIASPFVGQSTSYTVTLPPYLGNPGTVVILGQNGELGFGTAGLYENRIYVSPVNGNDSADGKSTPVKTIKRAAQLASFESFVLPGGRYLDAGNLLTSNTEFIKEEVVGFVTATYPGITTSPTYDRDICKRDIGYIVDALSYDLTYGGNSKARAAGLAYWDGSGSSYISTESTETIAAYEHLARISKYIINNVSIAATGGRFFDGANLFLDNKNFLAAEAVGFVTNTYPSILSNPDYDENTCKRDIGYIVDAVVYDLKYGGNYKSVESGLAYWSGGSSYVDGESTETIAAYEYIAGISSYVVNNVAVPISYQVGVGSTAQVFNLSLSYDATCSPSAYSSDCCADVVSAINSSIGIITSIIGVGTGAAPAITYPTGLFQQSTTQSFDLTIAYDEDCNPSAYSEDCCADVFSAINTSVGIITSIIGIGTTAAPAESLPTSKSEPVAVFVEAGEYVEDNPIILYEDVAIIGDNLRNTIIRPLNAGKDLFRVRNGCYLTGFALKDAVDPAGVPQYTFDYAVAFDDPTDPNTSRDGYAIKTSKPIITRSPYVQNCSILSFLGANGILVDGSKVDTPNTAIIAEESENPVEGAQPEFGKSMVAAAFTMVSFGGVGWRVINNGYSQVVSCFQIFCKYGSLAQSGGYLSITNSATNFGLYALRSTGFNAESFAFDRGRIASTGTFDGRQTLKVVGLGRSDQDLYVLRFIDGNNNDQTPNFKGGVTSKEVNLATEVDINLDTIGIQTHGFVNYDRVLYLGNEYSDPPQVIGGLVPGTEYYVKYITDDSFELYEDDSLSRKVDFTSVAAAGINTFQKGNQEFFNFETLSVHKDYQRISVNTGVGVTAHFVSGREVTQTVNGGTAVGFALTYTQGIGSTIGELIVSVESSAGVKNNFGVTGVGINGVIQDHSPAPVSIAATTVTGITSYFTMEFSVDSTEAGNVILGIAALPEDYRLHFHRPSIINSSSHTWEYSGSGTDYNALPQNGGKTRPETEQEFSLGGRVFTSGTNELGDFKIGSFITAYNRTGNIVFNNKVSIGELDSIRLSLSGGVAIEQFSADTGLGDNETGGPKNSRVSTQLAVRSFLNERLGNFIDKTVSANAIPSSVVQLNAFGQINQDLIPPKVVNYYQADQEGGRVNLVDRIPAVDLKNGDTVLEPSNGYILISDVDSQYLILSDNTRNYNFNNGDQVVSAVSNGGAIGIVTAPTSVGYGTTGLVKGVLQSTIGISSGGSGYTNPGIYTSITLSSLTGIGQSARASITVGSAGTVTNVTVTYGGRGYASGDKLWVSDPNQIGGRTGGYDFEVEVDDVETRLYLKLTNNQKFTGSSSLTDYISDGDAVGISTTLDLDYSTTFTPTDISVGGSIDFANGRILVGINSYSDGDNVTYSSQGGNVLGGLIQNNTYYVKRIGISSIELYTSYALSSKLTLLSSGTGTHRLQRKGVNIDTEQLTFVNHGFSVGDAVKVTGNTPVGIATGDFYFVGSITNNTFSLHATQSIALDSVNGLIFNPVGLAGTNTGTITFKKQNVSYSETINTSSSNTDNWSVLATTTIDAANIATGVISPSRLGTGSANSDTFLAGDSIYKKVVKSVGIGSTQPITVVASSSVLGPGISTYYGDLELRLDRVESTLDTFSTLGISKFRTSTFEIGEDGSVSVRNSSTGDIDAATFGGNGPSYYLDINNLTGAIPIARGGTGLSALPSNGAILIGNGSAYTLTTSPTFTGTVTADLNVPSNGNIVFANRASWGGEAASKIEFYNNNLYLQYTTNFIARNSLGTNRLTLDSSGNLTVGGTVSGTRLISTVANGTAPLTVTSSTLVTNLNADNLDGYTWGSSGKNVRATEFYADNWFRNYNSGEGLYNEANAMHWYSDSNNRWRLYSTQSTAAILFTTTGNNARGYVYADNSNNIGFLNQSGSWRLRVVGGDYTLADGSSIRGQLYYDSNNTGYYLNPNSTSQLHYVLANNWFRAQGDSGFYTQDYGSYLRRSTSASHGSWEVFGYNKGSYAGINIIYNYYNNLMYDSNGNGGVYQQNGSGWHFYWYRPYGCLGIGGSSTASGYRARVNGSLYVNGSVVVAGRSVYYNDNVYIQSTNIDGSYGSLTFLSQGTYRLYAGVLGTGWRPYTTNQVNFGNASRSWRSIACYRYDGGSDLRMKNSIVDSNLGLDFILRLRPVSWKWNNGYTISVQSGLDNDPVPLEITLPGRRPHYGFIAQDVKQIMDDDDIDFGGWTSEKQDNGDYIQMIDYREFIAPIVKAIQELSNKFEQLQQELNDLKN